MPKKPRVAKVLSPTQPHPGQAQHVAAERDSSSAGLDSYLGMGSGRSTATRPAVDEALLGVPVQRKATDRARTPGQPPCSAGGTGGSNLLMAAGDQHAAAIECQLLICDAAELCSPIWNVHLHLEQMCREQAPFLTLLASELSIHVQGNMLSYMRR